MSELLHVLLMADARVKITSEIVVGISEYVRLTENWIIDKDISYYSNSIKIASSIIQKRHLEGLICLNPSAEQEFMIQQCIDQNIPVLARGTNKQISGAINVVSNNQLIAKMAANHLLDLGLRHFAFFGYKAMLWSIQRKDEFTKRINQAGYGVDLCEIVPTQETIYHDIHFVKLLDWLMNLPKPIGIMACNDDFGLILLQCCRLSKIHVPEEIAVIGVDNDEVTCNLSVPGLTSIARDAQKAGFEGARLLHKKMKGQKIETCEILVNATHIVKRQSTEIMTIKDPCVLESLLFIERNILNNIGVEDVAAEVVVSRRNLDDHFTRTLGRTVFEVITQKRIAKLCEMLTNTHMTATQIAYECGFNDLAQMGGYFLRHKGISPGQYRKQHQIG